MIIKNAYKVLSDNFFGWFLLKLNKKYNYCYNKIGHISNVRVSGESHFLVICRKHFIWSCQTDLEKLHSIDSSGIYLWNRGSEFGAMTTGSCLNSTIYALQNLKCSLACGSLFVFVHIDKVIILLSLFTHSSFNIFDHIFLFSFALFSIVELKTKERREERGRVKNGRQQELGDPILVGHPHPTQWRFPQSKEYIKVFLSKKTLIF